MQIVRFTFDICLREHMNKDVYSMARDLEAGIMKVDGVCGCEATPSYANLSNYIDVDDIIVKQLKKASQL